MDPNETPTAPRPKLTAYIRSAVVIEVSGPVKDAEHKELFALLKPEQEHYAGMILALGSDGLRILKNRTGPVGFREFTPAA